MGIAINIGTDPLYVKYGAPDLQTLLTTNIYLPYHNNIPFKLTWDGDTTTDNITNKRMEAKLYYGASNTLLGTIVKQSVLVTGVPTYKFDFSEMLKTVLSPEIFTNITSDQINTGNRNLAETFYAVFTPIYIDIKGVERRDDSTTSSTYVIASSIFNYPDTVRTTITSASEYNLSSETSQFLTNIPSIRKIKTNETDQVSFLKRDANTAIVLHWNKYDLGGNVTSGSQTSVDCSTLKYGTFTVSDATVNCLLNGIANISKLEIWLQVSSTIVSEKITYIIDKNCGNDVRLWWRNIYGAIDKYTFTASNRQDFIIEDKQSYIDVNNRGKLLSSNAKQQFTVISDFVEYEPLWVRDLMASTHVYYEYGKDNLLPIEVITKEHIVNDVDNMIQVEITFTLADKFITHNG